MVVGFNCSDNMEITMRLLEDKGVKFPNIIDTSREANQFCLRKIQTGQTTAVPMTYIIDREGTIAGAWYGYDGNHDEGIRTLKALGVE